MKKIWVYSHLRDTPGTRITCETFRRFGYDTILVNPADSHLLAQQGKVSQLPHTEAPSFVYTRLGSSAPQRALYALRHLETIGFRTVNTCDSLLLCRDKFTSIQVMAAAGLPVPATVLIGPRETIEEAVLPLGAPPYIVKVPVSSKGCGVALAESVRSLRSIVDVMGGQGHDVLVQEFVAESKGSDLRVMVLGGEAMLAVRRKAVGDEFRSNVFLGGNDLSTEMTAEMAELAEKAAAIHGLQVAGVDLLETGDGFRIAEVNGSPGLSGPYNREPAKLDEAFERMLAKWTR